MTRKFYLLLSLMAGSVFATPFTVSSPTGFNPAWGGAFHATVAQEPFTVWCVDYLNYVASGDSYDVNISTPTSLAAIANTRYGIVDGTNHQWQNTSSGLTNSALDRYLVAAVLVGTFQPLLGSAHQTNLDIQYAIWSTLAVASEPTSPGTPSAAVNAVIAGAVATLNGLSDVQRTAFASTVRIYSESSIPNSGIGRFWDGHQEMITVSPEPGTFALFGIGLIAVGLVSRRWR
jgi:hypothetical protein